MMPFRPNEHGEQARQEPRAQLRSAGVSYGGYVGWLCAFRSYCPESGAAIRTQPTLCVKE